MAVVLSDEVLGGLDLTEADVRKELALALFAQERVSLGRAAQIAGVGRLKFMEWMGERGLYIHYDVEELEKDVATLKEKGWL